MIQNENTNVNSFYSNYNYSNNNYFKPNVKCEEECKYLLDNVLPLTSDYQIIIYNNIVEIKTARPNPSNPNNTTKKNRVIKKFSQNSRRRLSNNLGKIRFELYNLKILCTLTFHEKFPLEKSSLKKLVDNFNKSLKRFDEGLEYIWKLEFQKRGAPHFHYILLSKNNYSLEKKKKLNQFLRETWIRLVADDSEDFKKHSLDFREIYNDAKTVNYLLKYVGKIDESTDNIELGRYWALSNKIDFSPLRVVNVDEDFYESLRIILLRYIKQKYKINENDFERIKINNSFSVALFRDDILSLLNLQAVRKNRKYILAQISDLEFPDYNAY